MSKPSTRRLRDSQSSAFIERLVSRRTALGLLGATAVAQVAGCRSASSTPPASIAASDAVHFLTLVDIGRRIASREVSPVDLTERMLDRIGRIDPGLKSYATVMSEGAREAARAAEREIAAGKYRGPLHGVPIAVKDLCYTKGIRTMGGTAVRKDFVPDVDATVVSKLRDAGAVLLGKLNLSEGAAAGYNPALDVPLNPWNPDRWPGMSSSGSGVATAAGLCYAAIGTDTGGSIRNPSSANGVVGLKPTYGRVSRYGVLAMSDSLDHVGPMARSVADVAIMFDAIAGRDPKDPTSLDAAAPNAFRDRAQGIRGMRIGLDRDYALTGIDAGQAAAIEAALEVLKGLGAADRRRTRAGSRRRGRDVAHYLRRGDCGGACGDLSGTRERVRSVYAGVLGLGRACHPATARGRPRATCSADDAIDRRARVRRCGRRSRGRRSGMAHHTCTPSRIASGLPQGVVHRASAQRRVHDANGSRRRAGDLRAVWLLI